MRTAALTEGLTVFLNNAGRRSFRKLTLAPLEKEDFLAAVVRTETAGR